ncbi:hypothetical protein PG989_009769 [Apiospora arundinis]
MPIEKPLRVLLLGNGGREHAIAWRLSQSPKVEAIFVVPGNGGTALCPKTSNVSSVSAEDFPALAELAKKENVNFLVPGPEAPPGRWRCRLLRAEHYRAPLLRAL